MEAVRILKRIESDYLVELEHFKGRKVEIIIFPLEEESMKPIISKLFGSISNLPDGLKFQNNIRNEWKT